MEKAEQDLDTAKYNIKGKKLAGGLFFLQQSAEKALKVLYIKKFKKLFKTHNCELLSPAYQYTRYPDVAKVTALEQRADEFLEYAEEVLRWAKKNL